MDPLKMHRLIIAAVVESYLNRQIEYQDLLEIQHFIDNTLGEGDPDE